MIMRDHAFYKVDWLPTFAVISISARQPTLTSRSGWGKWTDLLMTD